MIHSVNQTPTLFQELKEHIVNGENARAWLGKLLSDLKYEDGSPLPPISELAIDHVSIRENSPTRLASRLIEAATSAYTGSEENQTIALSKGVIESVETLRKAAPESVQKSLEDYFIGQDDTP